MRRSRLALTLALWTLLACQRGSDSRATSDSSDLSAARQMVSRGRAAVMSAASGGQTLGSLRAGQIVLAVGPAPASRDALVEVVAHELRGWTRASSLEPLVLPRAAVSAVGFRGSPPPIDPCQISGPFSLNPKIEVWMEPQKRADSVRVEWGCTVGEASTDYYRIGWLEASPLAFDVLTGDPVACRPLFDSLPPVARRVLDSVWQLRPARCRAIRARTLPKLLPGSGQVSIVWPTQWPEYMEFDPDSVKLPDGIIADGRWLGRLGRETVGGITGPVVMRDGHGLVVDHSWSPTEDGMFRILMVTDRPHLMEVFLRSLGDDVDSTGIIIEKSTYRLLEDGRIERTRGGRVIDTCHWGATTQEYDCASGEQPRSTARYGK